MIKIVTYTPSYLCSPMVGSMSKVSRKRILDNIPFNVESEPTKRIPLVIVSQ